MFQSSFCSSVFKYTFLIWNVHDLHKIRGMRWDCRIGKKISFQQFSCLSTVLWNTQKDTYAIFYIALSLEALNGRNGTSCIFNSISLALSDKLTSRYRDRKNNTSYDDIYGQCYSQTSYFSVRNAFRNMNHIFRFEFFSILYATEQLVR